MPGGLFMVNDDTIKLLKECDSGAKMAVSAIDDVIDNVVDVKLKNLLSESKSHHEKLENEIHELLHQYDKDEKDPGIMAKTMSFMKTNMKMAMNESDATIADLMTDGCHMGIKSLYRYKNQYKKADGISMAICERLIDIEEQLCNALHDYL